MDSVRELATDALRVTGAYRKYIISQSIKHTRVQAGLSFGDESNSCLALVCIWYQPTNYCRSAHFGLLGALPSVGVTQDELYVMFYCTPHCMTICMGVYYEGVCATEEV